MVNNINGKVSDLLLIQIIFHLSKQPEEEHKKNQQPCAYQRPRGFQKLNFHEQHLRNETQAQEDQPVTHRKD